MMGVLFRGVTISGSRSVQNEQHSASNRQRYRLKRVAANISISISTISTMQGHRWPQAVQGMHYLVAVAVVVMVHPWVMVPPWQMTFAMAMHSSISSPATNNSTTIIAETLCQPLKCEQVMLWMLISIIIIITTTITSNNMEATAVRWKRHQRCHSSTTEDRRQWMLLMPTWVPMGTACQALRRRIASHWRCVAPDTTHCHTAHAARSTALLSICLCFASRPRSGKRRSVKHEKSKSHVSVQLATRVPAEPLVAATTSALHSVGIMKTYSVKSLTRSSSSRAAGDAVWPLQCRVRLQLRQAVATCLGIAWASLGNAD